MKLVTMTLGAALAAVSTLALAASGAPLPPPPAPGTGLADEDCLLMKDVRNHKVADQRTLLVDVFGKGVYRFNMASGCLRSAVSSDPIGIRAVGREKVCRPKQIDIGARSGVCIVDSIDRLSAEQAAALPRGLKP